MCKKTRPWWQFDFGAGFIYHFTAFGRLSFKAHITIIFCGVLLSGKVEVESLSIPRVTYER